MGVQLAPAEVRRPLRHQEPFCRESAPQHTCHSTSHVPCACTFQKTRVSVLMGRGDIIWATVTQTPQSRTNRNERGKGRCPCGRVCPIRQSRGNGPQPPATTRCKSTNKQTRRRGRAWWGGPLRGLRCVARRTGRLWRGERSRPTVRGPHWDWALS